MFANFSVKLKKKKKVDTRKLSSISLKLCIHHYLFKAKRLTEQERNLWKWAIAS